MSESQLFLEWTAEARCEGEVNGWRASLLRLLDARFPGAVPAGVREIIAKQDSLQMLLDDYYTALKAFSIDKFRAHAMR
jgi:hypothetical protein